MTSKKLFSPIVFLFLALSLSACDPNHDNMKDPDDFDPFEAIVDGSLQADELDFDRIYEGPADVVRYGCEHQGKIDLVIAPESTFVMKVTTPTVGSNCEPGGDYETAKIIGSVSVTGNEMYFSKCNLSEIKPEGLANYTLKKAEGAVTCYDTDPLGKSEKWLSVVFNVKRIVDGKLVE